MALAMTTGLEMKMTLKAMLFGAVLASSAISGMGAAPVLAATVKSDAATVSAFIAGSPGVRARAQNTAQELYVGVSNLGIGTNRTTGVLTYKPTQLFTVSYNFTTGVVRGVIGTVIKSYRAPAQSVFNALRVDITGPRFRGAGAAANYFSLTGLTVNGQAIGDLLGATSMPGTVLSSVISKFAPLNGNVTLTGQINYFGAAGNGPTATGDLARVDVRFGTLPAVVPVPAGLPLLLLALTSLALAAQQRRTAQRARIAA